MSSMKAHSGGVGMRVPALEGVVKDRQPLFTGPASLVEGVGHAGLSASRDTPLHFCTKEAVRPPPRPTH